MNFGFARRSGGKTILRYDDTNPEAEEDEYFGAIEREVGWLGHVAAEVTYSSTHFETLYQLALRLIRSGDAYVCHQTPEQVKASRTALSEAHHVHGPVPAAAKSPWRERTPAENEREFVKMRQGRVAEGAAFLRFKGDLASSNPNQWDLAAYRIKFTPHPASGRGWCIYPTYDFTHCLIDSIENVTHSLCTLEFESRQAADGSYYWLLEKLGMYKPQTWEYSRLNITSTVLSKRRLNTLVTQGLVDGWDDPRILTLAGLRRRGYSAEMVNKFCEMIGVTRSDGVVTNLDVLEGVARADLDAAARRLMVVLRPLRVTITNLPAPQAVEARNHPKDVSAGARALTLGETLYIDRSDFQLVDDPNYYGLAPGARAPRAQPPPPRAALRRGARARARALTCAARPAGAARLASRRQGGGPQVRGLLHPLRRGGLRRRRRAVRAARLDRPRVRRAAEEGVPQGRAALGARRGQGGRGGGAAVRPALHRAQRRCRPGLALAHQPALAHGRARRARRAGHCRVQRDRHADAARADRLLRGGQGQRGGRGPRAQSHRHAQGVQGEGGREGRVTRRRSRDRVAALDARQCAPVGIDTIGSIVRIGCQVMDI